MSGGHSYIPRSFSQSLEPVPFKSKKWRYGVPYKAPLASGKRALYTDALIFDENVRTRRAITRL